MKKFIIGMFFIMFFSFNTNAFAERYIVEFELSQSRFSLDLWEHLKDDTNKISFFIPVDKEFYDEIKVNQRLINKERIGSLIFNGSFSSWNINIKSKKIIQ